MPIITLEGPKITKDQKSELVKELTQVASKIYKMPEKSIIVVINELEPENVGSGGKLLSDIH